jgi:hypothetical protein
LKQSFEVAKYLLVFFYRDKSTDLSPWQFIKASMDLTSAVDVGMREGLDVSLHDLGLVYTPVQKHDLGAEIDAVQELLMLPASPLWGYAIESEVGRRYEAKVIRQQPGRPISIRTQRLQISTSHISLHPPPWLLQSFILRRIRTIYRSFVTLRATNKFIIVAY